MSLFHEATNKEVIPFVVIIFLPIKNLRNVRPVDNEKN